MHDGLLKEFTADEVRVALDNIGDLKAPGPDGMPAVFYKKFWDTVGDQVVHEVLGVLNGGPILRSGMKPQLYSSRRLINQNR